MKNKNLKKNFIWNTIGVFSLSITSFIYSLILVRLCDLSISGIWSYTFAIACTAVTLASFGGRTFQVTDSKGELSTYTYILARYITVSITVILILIFTLYKGFNINKSLILVLLCGFKFCEELSDVYYGVLQKHDALYIVGKSMFLKSLFNVGLFLVGIWFSRSLLIAVILILINNFLFFYFYDRKKATKLEKIDRTTNKKMLIKYFKSNLIICITLFLATYLVNCPKYVMESFLSDSVQGIYNLLALPATAVTLIGSFIINPMLVGIAEDYNNGQIIKIKKTSLKIVGLLLIFGFIILIAGYVLGSPVMNLIYGFDLTPYLKEFCLMIVGCTFYTISSILSMILISTRKLISQLIYNIMLSVIGYLVSLFLIKNYSIQGAVYSYLIIMLIRFIIYIIMIIFVKGKKDEKEKSTTPINQQ